MKAKQYQIDILWNSGLEPPAGISFIEANRMFASAYKARPAKVEGALIDHMMRKMREELSKR